MKIATAAVLLIKPDTNDTVIKNMDTVTHTFLPPSLYKNWANTSKNPVLTKDLLNINIAPIVITALLLKPDIACSIDSISNNNKRPKDANAVTSKGKISITKKTIAKEITNSKIICWLNKFSIFFIYVLKWKLPLFTQFKKR